MGAHVEKAARAGALNVAGAGISALGGIALTAALTNGLSRTTAGTIFAITSLFLVATAVVQLGTEVGLVRWLPVLIVRRRMAFLRPVIRMAMAPVLGAATVAALLGLFFAEDVASALGDGSGTAVGMVRVVAVFLPVAAAYQVLQAATRGLGTMRPTVMVEGLGRTVAQLVLVVLAIVVGWGATAVVLLWTLPYALGLAVTVVWLVALLRRRVGPRPAEPSVGSEESGPAVRAELATVRRDFWRFTGPRALGTVAQMALKRLDIVLVAALRSPAEAALYAAATRFVVVGQLGVQALQQALSPQLSALFAAGDRDGVRDVYRAATAWTMLLAWPVYLVTALLAPELLLLFGDGYTDVAPVVVLLSLAMLAATASGAVDVVLLMSGHTWLSLGNNVGAMVINIVLNLVLIPRYGALGAGIAWTIAIVLRNLLPLVQIRVLYGISPVSRQTGFVALSAAVWLGVVPGLMRWAGAPFGWVVAAIVVGMAVFVASAWRARVALHLDGLAGMLRARRTARAARLRPATP
jgi:O-antigen/teichoic acid export membrane protein